MLRVAGLSVPPLGGAYNSVVILSDTGLPAGATGTFSPPQVTPGSTGGSSMFSIQLAPVAAGIPSPGPHPFNPIPPLAAGAGLLIFLRLRRMRGMLRTVALSMAVLLLGTALVGCTGGFLQPPSTSPGSFTVNIIGSSGSSTHSTTVTVVIQ